MIKKTHHASVEEATESDNTTWVYILCDPNETLYADEPEWSKDWKWVDCKRCLKHKPLEEK